MSSAIKTPAFAAKAGNIQNEDGSSIYSAGEWSFKNASAVTGFHVDADGKVGIGTTSLTAGYSMTINGGISMPVTEAPLTWTGNGIVEASNNLYLRSTGAANVSLQTNGTERMRIDANGYLLVGSSTANAAGKMKAGGLLPLYIWRNSTSGSALIIEKADSTTSLAQYVAFSNSAADIGGGTVVGGIRRNSGNTAFEFYNASDERLKDVKGEFDGAVEKVKGIPVKWYAWKTDPSKEHFRFIAQDVQKHIPSAVSEGEDGYLMLGESDMFPVLWQAVREQQAIIEELKAKVSALESK